MAKRSSVCKSPSECTTPTTPESTRTPSLTWHGLGSLTSGTGKPVRLEMTEQLNQLLADTITLRDLYKKSHWQVAGPTFYQLHLLYDKHYEEQNELADAALPSGSQLLRASAWRWLTT